MSQNTQKQSKTNKALLLMGLWGISFVFLWYAVQNVDLQAMWTSITSYSPYMIAFGMGIMFIQILMYSFRKYVLFSGAISFPRAVQISFLCFGGNNIFPFRAGEVISILYSTRVINLPKRRIFSISFWERFADVQALACASLITLSLLTPGPWIFVLYGAVILLWIGIFCASWRPQWVLFILSFIPWELPRTLVYTFCEETSTNLTFPWLLKLIVTTILTWMLSFSLFIFAILYIGNIDLPLVDALTTTVLASLSLLIPSPPGGIGVFEASVVFALGLFSIPNSQALSIALVLHATTFFVPILGMLITMLLDAQAKKTVVTTHIMSSTAE